MHSHVEAALRTLFHRACIPCPNTTPACPACGPGESCSLSTKTCTSCPTTTCIKSGNTAPAPPPASSGSGTNAGAIAGGVIGAVVVIAVGTFLIWRFCLKGRRHTYEDETWEDERDESQSTMEKSGDFDARRDARASTHTVGSIASTVLTRASNVIQIAYIPGVTNRSPPSTPGLLVPPVPPLPFTSDSASTVSTPNYHQDQHFFMPDLRGSTYTGASDKRSTVARDSLAPSLARSSVATTVYRNDAVVEPMPAQQVMRGKAAVVSVKSSGANSPSDSRSPTPPLPAFDYEKLRQRGLLAEEPRGEDYRPPPSPAFSVGSTFMNSTADTAKAVVARPVNVRKPSKPNLVAEKSRDASPAAAAATAAAAAAPAATQILLPRTLSTATGVSTHSRAHRHDGTSSLLEGASDDDDESPGARARRSVAGEDLVSPVTIIDDTPALEQSPFSDAAVAPPSPGPPPPRHPARASSSSVTLASDKRPTPPPAPAPAPPAAPSAKHSKMESLSAVIKQATRRASQQPTHGGLGSRNRHSGPFSDSNEMKEEGDEGI